MSNVFGRTNITVPPLWFSLHLGSDPDLLVQAATSRPSVLDISSSPAVWGSFLAQNPTPLMVTGGHEVENAINEHHASDLISAHIIQTLSSLTRPTLDFYYLRVRNPLSEHQINGALAALDDAKNDGLIKYIGLMVGGSAFNVAALWRFHDAFETVLVKRTLEDQADYSAILPTALEKRAGLATYHPFGSFPQTLNDENFTTLKTFTQEHPVLLPINSPSQIPSEY